MAAGAHFTINQPSNTVPNGTTDVARIDIRQSQVVNLVGDSSSGQTSPAWTIMSWPFGSARAQPTNPTTFAASYTPDVPGSYRVQFLVNDGLGVNKKVFIFAVTQDNNGLVIDDGVREPAFGEEVGDDNASSNDRGYARAYEVPMAAQVPAVVDMAALINRRPSRHKQVRLLSHSGQNKGGGLFFWDATSTATHNGGTIVQPGFGTGGAMATGRWKRQFSGAIYADWFGVKEDVLQITDGVRTSGLARITSAAGLFTPDMVGRTVLIREPDVASLAAGTMTVAAGSVNVTATGTGTNVVAALPRISGAADTYEPASGGAIFIGNTYYAAFQVTASTQTLLLYQSTATQTTQPWYTETQRVLTVSAYVSATELTLSANAPFTHSSVLATIATDDTVAIRNVWQAAIDLGIRRVIHRGLSGISDNIGRTSYKNLTIEGLNPDTCGFVDLRKISTDYTYPNAQNYYGAISFVSANGVHIRNLSYDANVPVLGTVHSAGGTPNASGSRSGFVFYTSDDCSWTNCVTRGNGARDESFYCQGSSNITIERCRAMLTNNVSFNFNGGGDGCRLLNCRGAGYLLGADSLEVSGCEVTTDNHPRLAGSMQIGPVPASHIVVNDLVLRDLNFPTTTNSCFDCFGNSDVDCTLKINGMTIVSCTGIWNGSDATGGAPININNFKGTWDIRNVLIDKCSAVAAGGRFIAISGANLGPGTIGPCVFRGRAGSNMTVGIEGASTVPARAVTICPGTFWGESILTKWLFKTAVNLPVDLGSAFEPGQQLRDVAQTIFVGERNATFTADNTTETYTSTAHGLINGDGITLTTSGTLPAGLSLNTTYYVITSAANTFQLAATLGGSAINITDNGTGTHTWRYRGGNRFVCAEGTQTASRTKTISTVNATTNERVCVERRDTSAFTMPIANGGGGAGTPYTFPVSVKRRAWFKYDGTNWALESHEEIA